MRKTNQKRRRKQKRKTLKKRGGATGSGQFGIVFYDPRPLCENETEITPQMFSEAGKISYGNYDDSNDKHDFALKEYKILKKIQQIGEKKEIQDAVEKASKYINLPLKNCIVNSVMYQNNPSLKDEYKSNWATKSDFAYLSQTDNKDIKFTMTVYPKMKETVASVIGRTKDVKGRFEIVLGLKNIVDGFLFLESIGLFHYDFKFDNAMVSDDGTYKMIDLLEIGNLRSKDYDLLKDQLHTMLKSCVSIITRRNIVDTPHNEYVEEFIREITDRGFYQKKYVSFEVVEMESVEKYSEAFEEIMEIVRNIVDKMDNVSGKKRKSEEEMTRSS